MKQKDIKQQILEILTINHNGMTMKKLAEHLNITPYKLCQDIYGLENQNLLEIITVGSSKLVKIRTIETKGKQKIMVS